MSAPDSWPVVQLDTTHAEEAVARLLDRAADLLVNDLFFASGQDQVAVSVRHLGILRPLTVLPLELGRRCLAHIKVMAGMDMMERRRPQDGRWIWKRSDGGQIDLRICTIPTLHGEDFALRLLSRDFHLLNLDALGVLRQDFNRLLWLLNAPGGLILVTGPTGSGKTTTLYACLKYLHNGQRKINTIEDPIEYALDGIHQSQVNPKIDVGFADLLKSVLRQAPDIIMVGEIRDAQTAQTAVLGANSGHLVLATLHSPSAAGAVQSMLGLGVHPHFLANSLRGVIGQRLLRTLCPECKRSIDLFTAAFAFDDIKPWLEPGQGEALYAAVGCPSCLFTGYRNRTGVFEVLSISREIRQLIEQREPTHKLRQQADAEGMMTFRTSALLKVAGGETTVEEVMRTVPAEHLGLED